MPYLIGVLLKTPRQSLDLFSIGSQTSASVRVIYLSNVNITPVYLVFKQAVGTAPAAAAIYGWVGLTVASFPRRNPLFRAQRLAKWRCKAVLPLARG